MATPRTELARQTAARELDATIARFRGVRKVDPVTKYIGQRLRGRRLELNLSQSDVADALDVTFQQLQKYETGRNRVSGATLVRLAKILDVRPGWFFEGAPGLDGKASSNRASTANDLMASRDGVVIARAFVAIGNPYLRRALAEFVERLATTREAKG